MSLRPNARTEVRRNRYKVAVDADEGRRRREDNMVEIRKSKREESLLKKRREGLQNQPQFTPLQSSSIVEKKVTIDRWFGILSLYVFDSVIVILCFDLIWVLFCDVRVFYS